MFVGGQPDDQKPVLCAHFVALIIDRDLHALAAGQNSFAGSHREGADEGIWSNVANHVLIHLNFEEGAGVHCPAMAKKIQTHI